MSKGNFPLRDEFLQLGVLPGVWYCLNSDRYPRFAISQFYGIEWNEEHHQRLIQGLKAGSNSHLDIRRRDLGFECVEGPSGQKIKVKLSWFMVAPDVSVVAQ